MRILVVNTGSSTIKLSVLDGGETASSEEIEWGPDVDAEDVVTRAVGSSADVDAVGHRIVHGGHAFTQPVVLDEQVVEELERLTVLAPLHQPLALRGIALVGRALPDVPAVGCFDTSFFAALPEAARTYALPRKWREDFAIRRFGFHGLSHAYASRRALELTGRTLDGGTKIVTCHLGAGSSVAAVRGAAPVATSMGFTPLEGLVMATRSGDVDPGLLLWLQTQGGLDVDELEDGLMHRSGLLGLSGTRDMRSVLAGSAAGDPACHLALEVYVHRLRAAIAAMAAALDGVDVLGFTGGVGQNAAEVRSQAVGGLSFLGAAVDVEANSGTRPDAVVSAAGSSVEVVVVVSREDIEISRQVEETLE